MSYTRNVQISAHSFFIENDNLVDVQVLEINSVNVLSQFEYIDI